MSLNKSAMLYFDPAALDPNPLTAKTSQECVDAMVAVREAIAARPDLATPDVMTEVARIAQKLGAPSLTQAQGEQALESLRELFPNVLTPEVAAFATSAGSDVSWGFGDLGLEENKGLAEALAARREGRNLIAFLSVKDLVAMWSPSAESPPSDGGGSDHLQPEQAAPSSDEFGFMDLSLQMEALGTMGGEAGSE